MAKANAKPTNHTRLLLRTTVILIPLVGHASGALAQEDSGDPIAHEFIVRVAPGETIEDVASSYDAVILGSFPSRGLYLLGTPAVDPDEGVEDELEGDDRLDSHEQNSVNAVAEGHTQSFFVRTSPVGYSAQPTWGMLDLSRAQQLSRGAGVTVAVLDTGIAPHSALDSRVVAGGYSFVTNTEVADDASPGLLAGHGTFVAGLIHRVAPEAELLPIAVLSGDGVGNSFMVAEGVYYAIDHGARVINLSLSSPVDSLAVRDAIDEALALGIVVVASVGNSQSTVASFPAADSGVLAVASTDLGDHLALFTDRGPFVSLCAPGVGLVSLLPSEDYGAASGTSFSTAIISGTAALIAAQSSTESAGFVVDRLRSTALNLISTNQHSVGDFGSGRVRPLQALLRRKPIPSTTGPR